MKLNANRVQADSAINSYHKIENSKYIFVFAFAIYSVRLNFPLFIT